MVRADAAPKVFASEEFALNLEKPMAATVDPPAIAITHRAGPADGAHSPYAVILPPRPDPQLPNAAPALPPDAHGLAASGPVIVVIRAMVLENGSIGDASVADSCGRRELDAFALRQVKEHWHFLPAVSNGRAVRNWVTVEVLFNVHNADRPT